MAEMTDFGKKLRNSHKMRRIELIHFYEYLIEEGVVAKDGAAHQRMTELKQHVTIQDRKERLAALLSMKRNKKALK